uniref:TPT domain-containing protein n=1 Tax=Caenorhabditis tropicalis TaxID=1561998 RepID=A0A1I7UJ92_9PELO
MTIIGFIAFILILDKFAFNFMFLRLWQFSTGFMALFWIKLNKNLPKEKEDTVSKNSPITQTDFISISLTIIGSCLLPRKLDVMVLRPMVTVATAVLIGCESKNVF